MKWKNTGDTENQYFFCRQEQVGDLKAILGGLFAKKGQILKKKPQTKNWGLGDDGPASQVHLHAIFFSGIRVERIENGLEMLQGLLIIQLFPPKQMIFLLCSFELASSEVNVFRLKFQIGNQSAEKNPPK